MLGQGHVQGQPHQHQNRVERGYPVRVEGHEQAPSHHQARTPRQFAAVMEHRPGERKPSRRREHLEARELSEGEGDGQYDPPECGQKSGSVAPDLASHAEAEHRHQRADQNRQEPDHPLASPEDGAQRSKDEIGSKRVVGVGAVRGGRSHRDLPHWVADPVLQHVVSDHGPGRENRHVTSPKWCCDLGETDREHQAHERDQDQAFMRRFELHGPRGLSRMAKPPTSATVA